MNSKGFKWSGWIKEMNSVVDNGTTTIYILTPKGWKCKRKGCKADYKHSHSTYSDLFKAVDNSG